MSSDAAHDQTDDAEFLDGDVLGEEIGDDGLPGIGDFPADQALGVNDPNLVADDDVAMREARTRHEDEGAGADEMNGERIGLDGDLLRPDGDDDLLDSERLAIADVGDADRADLPAEVAAMHVIDDD